MSEIELKPCPFCGGEAEVNIFIISSGIIAGCMCTSCFASSNRFVSPDEDDAKAAVTEAWNRRVEG
jgi:Lar family restriction alleviation protein